MTKVLAFPTAVFQNRAVAENAILARLRQGGSDDEAARAILDEMRPFLDLCEWSVGERIDIQPGPSDDERWAVRTAIASAIAALEARMQARTNALMWERLERETSAYYAVPRES